MHPIRLFGTLAAVATATLLAPATVHAQQVVSGTFTVTAEVLPACSLQTRPMNFGTYDPAAGVEATASTSLEITCSTGAAFTVSVDAGRNATDGTCLNPRRKLAHDASGALIAYELYADAARLQPVGCDPSNDLEGVGTGAIQALPLYGVLSAGQAIAAGAYSDVISVTLNF